MKKTILVASVLVVFSLFLPGANAQVTSNVTDAELQAQINQLLQEFSRLQIQVNALRSMPVPPAPQQATPVPYPVPPIQMPYPEPQTPLPVPYTPEPNTAPVPPRSFPEPTLIQPSIPMPIPPGYGQDNPPWKPDQSWCYTFSVPMGVGASGEQVRALRIVLEKEGFPTSGENEYYDEELAAAVSGFQEKWARDVLDPVKLKRSTGYTGKMTLKKLGDLYGCKKPLPTPPPLAKSPHILKLAPSSGPVGTMVTVVGSGLRGSNLVTFGKGIVIRAETDIHYSQDGKTLTFYVPSSVGPACLYRAPLCEAMPVEITPGTYPVSISNEGGASNEVTFTVTPGSAMPTPGPATLNILAPTSGEKWVVGGTYNLRWKSSLPYIAIGLDYLESERAQQYTVMPLGVNTGSHAWTIPDLPAGLYQLQFVGYHVKPEIGHASGPAAVTPSKPFTITKRGGVQILNIEPSSGWIGDKITIKGIGFEAKNTIQFGKEALQNFEGGTTHPSKDGKTIVFTIPKSISPIPRCAYENPPSCKIGFEPLRADTYPVSVANGKGRSNEVTFNVREVEVPPVKTIGPRLEVTAPKAGETLTAGASFALAWRNTAVEKEYPVKELDIFLDGPLGGAAGKPQQIAGLVPNSGSFLWNIAASQQPGKYRLLLLPRGPLPDWTAAEGTLSETFVIQAPATELPSVKPLELLTPNGGEVWQLGQDSLITWRTSPGFTANRVYLYLQELSTNAGSADAVSSEGVWRTIRAIGSAPADSGIFYFPRYSFGAERQFKVRISNSPSEIENICMEWGVPDPNVPCPRPSGFNHIYDDSNAPFTYSASTEFVSLQLDLVAPLVEKRWDVGSTQTIAWTYTGTYRPENVRIYLAPLERTLAAQLIAGPFRNGERWTAYTVGNPSAILGARISQTNQYKFIFCAGEYPNNCAASVIGPTVTIAPPAY